VSNLAPAEPDDAPAPGEQPVQRPRWWPAGVGSAIALVVVWSLTTAWVETLGS
jgi:hypothetical protein